MGRIVRLAFVLGAFLAVESVISCAQNAPTTGAAGTTASADPGRPAADGNPGAGKNPANSNTRAPGGSTSGGDWPPRCPPGPPYTSLPCPVAKQ